MRPQVCVLCVSYSRVLFCIYYIVCQPLKGDRCHPCCCYEIGGKEEKVPVHLPTTPPTYCLLTSHGNDRLSPFSFYLALYLGLFSIFPIDLCFEELS